MAIETLLPPEGEDFIKVIECEKDKAIYTHKRTTLAGMPAFECMGPCKGTYLAKNERKDYPASYHGSI